MTTTTDALLDALEELTAWIPDIKLEYMEPFVERLRAALTAPAPDDEKNWDGEKFAKTSERLLAKEFGHPAPAAPVGYVYKNFRQHFTMGIVKVDLHNKRIEKEDIALYDAPPPSPLRAVADGLAEAVRELKASLFSEKVNYGRLSPETFAAIHEIKIADAALAAYAAAKEAGG